MLEDLLIKKFDEHCSKYDLKIDAIRRKYDHSYRVMKISYDLAINNSFNETDIYLSKVIGLLHDYARFEQWTCFNTYSDLNSVDHGDLAVKRLFDENEIADFNIKTEYYDEIKDSIKYHNKYMVPSNLSNHNRLLCNVIRDADKLDIFFLLGENKNLLKEDDNDITDLISKKFYNCELLKTADIKNKNDNILLHIAMVFDLNFKYSYLYLSKTKLIEKIFDNIIAKKKFEKYFEFVLKFINDKCK